MTITTPLPDPPSMGSPETFEQNASDFFGALPGFQSEMNTFADNVSQYGRNLLDNAAFQIAERFVSATSVADDVYGLDRWYVLTQTASVNVSQLSAPEDGYTHAMRLAQNQASAQRMGFAQIIQGNRCKHLRGQSATLVPRIRCSSSQPIRYAILGWTGTEDTVTSDVVNSWTNSTFTAGQFFISTTTQVLGVGVVTPSAAVWTSLTALTASVGSTFNNLIVMVWTEGTAAQNVTLDVDAIQLERGITATPPEVVPYHIELVKCRYHFRRIPATAPNLVYAQGFAYSTTAAVFHVDLQEPMRALPAMTGTAITMNNGVANFVIGSLAVENGTGGNQAFGLHVTGSSGLTAGAPLRLIADNNPSSFLAYSADM